MKQPEKLLNHIPAECAGLRLDQALVRLFPQYSRARLQHWIKRGRVSVNGEHLRPRDLVCGGEQIVVYPQDEVHKRFEAESIPLDLVYEDAQLLVINKPPGMVVHPAAGNWQGTLLNALLHYAPELQLVPRGGIVHRLDKDTSGLMVVARTLESHKHLIAQLQARHIRREYLALVHGLVISGGTISGNIGRHPVHRKRMAVVNKGKPAITHYRVVRRFRHHTLLRVKLETGRTHQIRVHLASIGYPIIGDAVYGGRKKFPPRAAEALLECLRSFDRQALHAALLGLVHPATSEAMQWEAPVPEDMTAVLQLLQQDVDREVM